MKKIQLLVSVLCYGAILFEARDSQAAAAASSGPCAVDHRQVLRTMLQRRGMSKQVVDSMLECPEAINLYDQQAQLFSKDQLDCLNTLLDDRVSGKLLFFRPSPCSCMEHRVHCCARIAKQVKNTSESIWRSYYHRLTEYIRPSSSYLVLPYWFDIYVRSRDPYAQSMIKSICSTSEARRLPHAEHDKVFNEVSRAVARHNANIYESSLWDMLRTGKSDKNYHNRHDELFHDMQKAEEIVGCNNGRLLARLVYSTLFSPDSKKMLLRIRNWLKYRAPEWRNLTDQELFKERFKHIPIDKFVLLDAVHTDCLATAFLAAETVERMDDLCPTSYLTHVSDPQIGLAAKELADQITLGDDWQPSEADEITEIDLGYSQALLRYEPVFR